MENTIKELKTTSAKVFPLVRNWAEDRGLISGGSPFTQSLKLYEEFGELCGAVLKNKPEDIKDAVGDIIIVLVNLNAINGIDLESGIETYESETISNDTKICLGSLSYFCNIIQFSEEVRKTASASANIINFLDLICYKYDFTISDCLVAAWNVIKNRTGKTVNGNFIKDEE
jgi:hypothetical protein